ncbi:hypothetical protein J4210_05325 [Candidatus Woesearchaeota archaeon]|nr:hypothetical protein [Candidatus Woesearchaeota archaeon]
MSDDKKPELRLIFGGNRKVIPLFPSDFSDQTLRRLLAYLATHDPLFDYNVPPERRELTSGDLGSFLRETYLQREFAVSGEDAVRRYLQRCDFVDFSGPRPVVKYATYLRPGMRGIITDVDLQNQTPLTILWEQCPEIPHDVERQHDGSGLALLLSKDRLSRKKITRKVELLAAAEPGSLVEPTEVTFTYAHYLPLGTRGIVQKIDDSAELPVSVLFGNREKYIPPPGGIFLCPYNSLTLIRENKIDLRDIIKRFGK